MKHSTFSFLFSWTSISNRFASAIGIQRLASAALAATVPALCAASNQAQTDTQYLWQIGKPDNGNSEFALAPNRFRNYDQDGFFVVGESDSKRDWPYVHPGPSDSWAGTREHTATILFALKAKPATDQCQLRVRLLDTHSGNPSKLRVVINGREYERPLPKGAGDASIQGDPKQGHPTAVDFAFSSDLLRAGNNDIQITTLAGSWILYDWLGLEAPQAELAPVSTHTVISKALAVRALREKGGRFEQPVLVTLRHAGAATPATLLIDGTPASNLELKAGEQTIDLSLPAVQASTERTISLRANDQELARRVVTLRPVRKLTIYVLPHSHTDIGYTEIQTDIEKKQVKNLLDGIAAARRTAEYPEGARFIWNVEVLWAADLYLRRLSESQRAEFFDAVKRGWVGLNGMYLNELTGLCRPEELVQLFRFATELGGKTGTPIDSVMISDVPGYTWGSVTAMAQAGIRYFSTAPNYFDRIGDILVQWENKPFWWTSPSGKERILVWIPYMGYAMSHLIHHFTPEFVDEYQSNLEKQQYPYDIAYVRWSGHGDNAVPDPAICEFFKDWNTKYAWPKFQIARTSDAFRAFEARYGGQLPSVRGDWTPYWEDGAGSSALETAMNRNTSDRLVQAEALFALDPSNPFPAEAFNEAWRNTLLYSEHTWGADCSVSDPESKKTLEQWEIKRSYAVQADEQSRQLLARALRTEPKDAGSSASSASGVVIINTTSWPRTELVRVSAELTAAGDRVADDQGNPVYSQRLSTGELAFVVRGLDPFASRRYTISSGPPVSPTVSVKVTAGSLDNGRISLKLDPTRGGIVQFKAEGIPVDLADTQHEKALNEFLFLPGEDLKNLQSNGQVSNTIKESGPLVASLRVESSAPGCNKLVRDVQMVAGFDHVELIDTVDKQRAAIPNKRGDWAFAQKGGKESVNFAFPFNIPGGEVSLDLPLGWMRVQRDQMPSACKNWFTVGRWADVANAEYGVTLVTLDAPLLEVGGLTANMTGSQTNPKAWRKEVEPTQRIFVWAMNNHWHTNYRAYQDGPVTFRFVLRPHGQFDPAEASRFSAGFSQPLLARAADDLPVRNAPRLQVTPNDVLVSCLKPSDDGKAWIIRLFGASGKDRAVSLTWNGVQPKGLSVSDTSEKAGRPVTGAIEVPAWDLVTIRAECP